MGANKIKFDDVDMSATGGWGAGKVLSSNGTFISVLTGASLGVLNSFVSKSGNDGTAVVGDISKPFLTITAAMASSATDIYVFAGTYAESFTIPTTKKLISAYPNSLMYKSGPVSAVTYGGAKRPVYINGTITVSADSVEVVGVNCDTLSINHASSSSRFASMIVGTAIDTNQASVNASFYDVHSDKFLKGNISLGGYYAFCSGGQFSFAGDNTQGGTLNGTFFKCYATSNAFAGSQVTGGVISGTMDSCIGSSSSFAGSSVTGGSITGTVINCEGSSECFAGGVTGGSIGTNGVVISCKATTNSFAGGSTTGGSIVGTVRNCTASGNSFASGGTTGGTVTGILDDIYSSDTSGLNATITGVIRNSRISQTGGASAAAIVVGAGARVEYCVLKGTTNAVRAASAITADITHCKLIPNVSGNGLHANITNASTTPYNTNVQTSLY